jgi:hypothetical protein
MYAFDAAYDAALPRPKTALIDDRNMSICREWDGKSQGVLSFLACTEVATFGTKTAIICAGVRCFTGVI